HLRPLLYHPSSPLYCPPHPRALPSFPTRRSSDLPCAVMRPPLSNAPRRSSKSRALASIASGGGSNHRRSRESCVPQLASTGLARSEEHTSELQSLAYLVCRLLLEKKKKKHIKQK